MKSTRVVGSLALAVCIPAGSPAMAESGLDAGTGYLTAPSAETVPRGKSVASLALGGAATGGDPFAGSAFPVGIALGMTHRTELGAAIEVEPWESGVEPGGATGLGMHVRQRIVIPDPSRPAVSAQVDLEKQFGRTSFGVGGIASQRVDGAILSFAAGPRFHLDKPVDGEVDFGGEMRVNHTVHFLGELGASADVYGFHRLNLRAGVRRPLGERLMATGWAGGGREQSEPWWGGGVALALYAVDPTEADGDQDLVRDWTDRCPLLSEDPDSFQDEDGCPDPDNDGDGVPDVNDPTPNGEEVREEKRFEEETPRMKVRRRDRDRDLPDEEHGEE